MTTTMPPPTNDSSVNKDVHVFKSPLFNRSQKDPTFDEVMQAPGIANCPVAAILAALAFARPKSIRNLVSETVVDFLADIRLMLAFSPAGRKRVEDTSNKVLTDLSKVPPAALSNPSHGTMMISFRYFSVELFGGKKEVSVSDVLYTDDHDRGWSPLYMRDPSGGSIWAAIVEKALAMHLGSYENFDATDIKANEFWEKITGAKPDGFAIKPETSLATITDAARDSTQAPSIAASKDDAKLVTPFHGFAIMGLQGTSIRLYDPAKARTLLISPADFRSNFQAVLVQK